MRSNLTPPIAPQPTLQPAIQQAAPLPDPVTIPGMAPWLVALLRAGGLAIVAGLLAFLAAVPNTHDPWVIIPEVLVAILSALGYGGAAAVADTARAHNAAAQAARTAK